MQTQLIQITPFSAHHYFDFWLQLYRHPSVNPFFFKSPSETDDYMRTLYERYLNNKNVRFFIYADDNRRPIGTCRVTFFEGARSHVAMLNAVAISPEFHGQGYGTKLLKDVEQYIINENRQISQIELAYEGDNPAGKRIYEQKSEYEPKITYQDWWIRHDPEFKEKYPWYTEERCCVKYLHDTPQKTQQLPLERLQSVKPLSNEYSIESFKITPSTLHFDNILKSYREDEATEIRNILSKPGQTLYTLIKDDSPIALLCVRPYEDSRLKHSVVMPCIAFADDIDNPAVSSFVSEAISQYRQQFQKTVHIACSEEDTEEQFFTNNHSKIVRLNTILQHAGFESVGYFENYFNETAHSGSTLFGFECSLLNLNDAKKCVQTSPILQPHHQKNIQALIDKLLDYPQDQLSNREAYEIYRMIRYVAYPQDYSSEEKKAKITCAIKFLQDTHQYYLYQKDLAKLMGGLYQVIEHNNYSPSLFSMMHTRKILPQDRNDSQSLNPTHIK